VEEQAPSRSRRLGAVVALGAPVPAVVLALSPLSRPGSLVLAIICAAGGAVASWYALTRRGWPRWLALAAFLVLSGAAVIAGLVLLLAALLFLLIYGAAAGYALGRYENQQSPWRPVAAAGNGVLIVNPRSGGGKAARARLVEAAGKRGIIPVLLQPGSDLSELAEHAVAEGADVIGMAGGDGSQALVAAVAMRHGIPHVCVPAGTRNHFALDLGLDRADILGALDAYTNGVERTIDLARVNDRIFVNNASVGLYARVVQSSAYRDAKLRTWAQMLPDMLGPRAAPIDLEFQGPGDRRYQNVPLVIVSNNPYDMRPTAKSVSRPRLDTGQLGIIAARIVDPAAATVLARNRESQLLDWTEATFEIRSSAPVPIGIDGEALILEPPLRFVSLPGALQVRLPANAPGLIRHHAWATTPSRRNVIRLLRVAAGRPLPATTAE
jgi:diacylglycerol kinase family enzyme